VVAYEEEFLYELSDLSKADLQKILFGLLDALDFEVTKIVSKDDEDPDATQEIKFEIKGPKQ